MSDTKPRRQPITMFGLGQRCGDWRLQPETTFCGTFTTSDADVELLREIDMAGNQALYGVGVPAPRPTAPEEGLLARGEIVEEWPEGYFKSQYLRGEIPHRRADAFLRDGVWSHCFDAADSLVVFRRGFTAENGEWKRGAEPERLLRTCRATFENVVGGDVENAFWGDVETTSGLALGGGLVGARFGINATRRFELPLAATVFRVGASSDFVFTLGLAKVEESTATGATDFDLNSDALPPFQEGDNVYRTPPQTLSASFSSTKPNSARSVVFDRLVFANCLLQVDEAPMVTSRDVFVDGVRFADARITGTMFAQIGFSSSRSLTFRYDESRDPADYDWTPSIDEIGATLNGWAAPWIEALFDAGRRNLEARWSVAVERSDMTIGDANGEPFPDDAIAAEVRARRATT